MQFLKISPSTLLHEINKKVGSRNVDIILAKNRIQRTPYIGKQLYEEANKIKNSGKSVTWQQKSSILNGFTQDSDIFEEACMLGEDDWKVLASSNSFPNMLRIPETIKLKDDIDILGNGVAVTKDVYKKVMTSLEAPPHHEIDMSAFNSYSSRRDVSLVNKTSTQQTDLAFNQWFNLPWGDVTLYSSLDNTTISIPVYPEEIEDVRAANYTEMPEIIYQAEPWYTYQSSGPRSNTYSFHLHRDMWTGDHRDGKCNELVRFCEACCYPEYNGSAVNTTTVTLYVKGEPLISGILTKTTTKWSGPIGLDGFYLECDLSIEITEVSDQSLSYQAVKKKGLIH